MTEQEWQNTEDPFELLRFLQAGRWWRRLLPRRLDSRRADLRKMRLLACAYERMAIPSPKRFDGQRLVMETAERYADGKATVEELRDRTHDPGVIRLGACDDDLIPTFQWWERVWRHLPMVDRGWVCHRLQLCVLLRCLFNPFRRITVSPNWLTPTVVSLAQSIYDERAFDRLPILADALEDAGCTNGDVLTHCRQPGEHVRGCWVVDLILGKK